MICKNVIRFSSNLLKNLINKPQLNSLKCTSSFSTQNFTKNNQNLVIDLSFEDLMTSEECHRLALDLNMIYHINNLAQPEKRFDINICHQLSKMSLTIDYLGRYLPSMENQDHFHIRGISYLNLFDKNRLVYLSPDAKDVIDFDSNDIYIIGGIVQKKVFRRDSNNVTYSKAKRDGIRVGRFPIDHLISDQMKRGFILFLPQVFNILSDVKVSDNWESAVRRHLPNWKLKPLDRFQRISY